ncbi:MAG: cytochrome bc complex cytochrome b subunit [Thioalkalispiraceae bacterium]|jgi:ubiquinol-cytochrome c reductase cytochrome b subunit
MNMMMALLGWVDDRFPLTKMWKEHLSEYYAPKNFNFWYYFGSLALLVLVIQIVSGIFLTIHYKPDAELAFASVEYIMRDVEWGWFIRYMHSTGASAFFIVVYLHMFRGLIYGSYRKPRELIWIFGVFIYLALMAEAFFGYLLPWGQMSYWGAQVIVNLFAAVPFGIGEPLSEWIRGDYVISDATLNRFFAFHVIAVPLVLIMLIAAHIIALHEVGSNNPDGVEIKKNKGSDGIPLDGIPFHPYYTVKDIMGVVVFLIAFFAVVFFAPTLGGLFIEAPNFEPANPLKTPDHIAPVWYFTPFYAMLRAVPPMFASQFPGVIVMGAAIVVLFFLPWLDKSPVKSIRYKDNRTKLALAVFVIAFGLLGYFGVVQSSNTKTMIAQAATLMYFGYFLYMPFYSRTEITATGVRAPLVALYTIVTVGIIFYWFNADGVTVVNKAIISVVTLAFTIYFLILPAYSKPAVVKPVPERVTK